MISIINILPFDIIEQIIQHVATHDYQEHKYQSTYIKACSLTCRTFFEAGCRKHMFRCILVAKGKKNWRKTFELFAKFLIDRGPTVGSYVLELCFMLSDGKDGPHGEFAQALLTLTNLDCLTIIPDYRYHPGRRIYWRSLNTSTVSILLQAIHIPTIQILKLRNIDHFTPVNLMLCPNLRHLVVDNTSFDFENRITTHDAHVGHHILPTPIRPQNLELSGNNSILLLPKIIEKYPQFSSPISDLNNLRTLSLIFDDKVYTDVYDAAATLFRGPSSLQLEEINFRFKGFHPTEIKPTISLAFLSLQTLKRLNLDVQLSHEGRDPLLGLPALLHEISGKNSIEVLKISIRTFGASLHVRDAGEEWTMLEKVLLEPEGWKSLKRVDLTVVTGFRGRPFEKALEDLPRTRFLGLVSSHSINFNFLVCDFL